jgi:16S rRNA (cytosine967-C5)-methyltransferase
MRSFAALGGGLSGRGLVLGGLRAQGLSEVQIAALFSGQGHDPSPLGPQDTPRQPSAAEAVDMPDWLIPLFEHSLGAGANGVMQALRARAPVFVRVNPKRATRAQVQAELAQDGVETVFVQNVNYALEVTNNARKIQNLPAYLEGRIELQDAASQAVIEALDLPPSGRILDYCAGGGGKTLSLFAQVYDNDNISIFAHDASFARMKDLPARAARAGADITVLQNPSLAMPYDMILTDVPCSGSGSWRRDPQGKWALTAARLETLCQTQAQIIDAALGLLGPNGRLAYVTCSVLHQENEAQVSAALQRHAGLRCAFMQRFGLGQLGGFAPNPNGAPIADGFFLAVLTQSAS